MSILPDKNLTLRMSPAILCVCRGVGDIDINTTIVCDNLKEPVSESTIYNSIDQTTIVLDTDSQYLLFYNIVVFYGVNAYTLQFRTETICLVTV